MQKKNKRKIRNCNKEHINDIIKRAEREKVFPQIN